MPSTINATPTSSGLVQSADASGVLALQTGGTTAVTIDGSQNVGIGTGSPNARLEVLSSTAGAEVSRFEGNYASNGSVVLSNWRRSGGAVAAALKYSDNNPFGMMFGTTTSHAQIFMTADTERMRIDSSGNLLVGTTATFDAAYTMSLQVRGGTGGLVIKPETNDYTPIAFRNAANTQVGTISATSSATAYNTSSDYRLKENIAPMTGALATVAQLKPVTYNWKIDGSDGQGFIAHELQSVVPDCVTGEKDAVNEDGSIKAQGIDTSFLVATLTAAIQEQQALITQLQADVAALKVQP